MILMLVLLITIYLVYLVRQYYRVWQYSEKFPGKNALPLIGNGHQVGTTAYDYLKTLISLTKEYDYNAFRIWLGPQLFIMITSPKDVEIILSSNKYLDKFDDYRFFHDWIGNGLVTINGLKWFRQRKLITPSFHFKILNDFHGVMNKGVNRLVVKLNDKAKSSVTFDIQNIVNSAMLDTICETAMGVEVNALENPESPIVTAFHDMSSAVYDRIFSAWKRYDLLFPLSQSYQKHIKALKILRDFNKEVIEKRKEFLKNSELNNLNNIKNNDDDDDDADANNISKPKKVFLDTLLTTITPEGNTLTDEEISDEVSTFVFAGHDTTASAISFALYHLSIHPKEQEKVYDEQKTIFTGRMLDDSTYQDVQDMKYLECFMKESQRVIPSVPFIGRAATEPIQLSDGKIVPTGASIGIFLYPMGHNPKSFPNPDKFDSTRFYVDERTNKNPYEYVPFSAGPRNCIGQRFAMLEIRIVLSMLIRHFEILPADDKSFKPMPAATSTTRSVNGVMIRLKQRNL